MRKEITKEIELYSDYKYWHNYVQNADCISNSIEEVIIESNKKRIHIDILNSSQTGKIKLNLIFIHGTSVYSRFYSEFCHKLSEKGYRIFIPDMPGHGLSEGLRGHFKISEYIQVIGDVIRFIEEKFSGNIVIIGSSLGGITSFYVANSILSNKLSGVICHNAAILNEKAYKQIIKVNRFLALFIPIIPFLSKLFPKISLNVFRYLPKKSLATTQYGEELFYKLKNDPLLSYRYTLQSLSEQIVASLDKPLNQFDVPILFINGENDELFSKDFIFQLFERIPTNNKQINIIKNAGHFIFQEKTLEAVEITNEFLMKLDLE